jgi:hypothetical protein
MADYQSIEMEMTAIDVVLLSHPEIMGEVVYLFGFKVLGIREDFEIEITDVEVKEIKNPVYNEDGNPVMVSEFDKQKFSTQASEYFWKNLIPTAISSAMDRVQSGST